MHNNFGENRKASQRDRLSFHPPSAHVLRALYPSLQTERSCGLLWNAILSLWLSPQDFRPPEAAKDMGGGCGWDLPLGEHHGRIYAKACEVSVDFREPPAHGALR